MHIQVKKAQDPATLKDVWEIIAPDSARPYQRIAQLIEPAAQTEVGYFQAITPSQRYVDLNREEWHSARNAGAPIEGTPALGLGTSR